MLAYAHVRRLASFMIHGFEDTSGGNAFLEPLRRVDAGLKTSAVHVNPSMAVTLPEKSA